MLAKLFCTNGLSPAATTINAGILTPNRSVMQQEAKHGPRKLPALLARRLQAFTSANFTHNSCAQS